MTPENQSPLLLRFISFSSSLISFVACLFIFFPTGYFAMSNNAVPGFYFIYYAILYPRSVFLSNHQLPVIFKLSLCIILYQLYCGIYLAWNRFKGKKLITTGPYKRIRHPQYLCILIWTSLMSLGVYFKPNLYLIWPTPSTNIYIPKSTIFFMLGGLFLLYTGLTILEDRFLQIRFPKAYDSYKSNSWLIFPKYVVNKTTLLRQVPTGFGWILLMASGMPVYKVHPVFTEEYITVEPLGYVLYRFLLQTNTYSGFFSYLREYMNFTITFVLTLLSILILFALKKIQAYYERSVILSENEHIDSLKKRIGLLSNISILFFIGLSLTLNFLSLIYRYNFPLSYAWEMSNIVILGVILCQIITQTLLIYSNRIKKSTNSLQELGTEHLVN